MTEDTNAAPPVADRMAAARAARAAKQAEKAEKAAPPVATPPVEPAPDQISPAGPTTMEKAAATDKAKRDAKIAALRAAKVASADPAAEAKVTVRITKKGHGQVSMGEHINGLGDLTYDFAEMPEFPLSIAQELEDRGFVEIQ